MAELYFYKDQGETAQQRYERNVREYLDANGPKDPIEREQEFERLMLELYPDWTPRLPRSEVE